MQIRRIMCVRRNEACHAGQAKTSGWMTHSVKIGDGGRKCEEAKITLLRLREAAGKEFSFLRKSLIRWGRISVFPRRDVNDRPSSVLILSGVFGNGSRKDWNRECVKEGGVGGGAACIIMLSTCTKFCYHFCGRITELLNVIIWNSKYIYFFFPSTPSPKLAG